MSLGFGKTILGVMQYTLEYAREFSLPLLLMHGKADSITYSSGSIEFASKLDEKCKLVLWEGASHELHNEPEKAEVLKTMTDWINEQLKN
jgi:alpha-beta hydrolase superfamily lysophospholipase